MVKSKPKPKPEQHDASKPTNEGGKGKARGKGEGFWITIKHGDNVGRHVWLKGVRGHETRAQRAENNAKLKQGHGVAPGHPAHEHVQAQRDGAARSSKLREQASAHRAVKGTPEQRSAKAGELRSKHFAGQVQKTLPGVGKEGRFGSGKVFVSHAHAAYEKTHGPISASEFKAKLLKSNNARHLDLAPADFVEAMDARTVAASKIVHPLGSEFHFIRQAQIARKRS